MSTKTILIPYISTGLYSKMFPGFIESLHRFAPEYNKKVIVLTDDPMQFVNYEDRIYSIHKIDHLPWPIVALMKFKHILFAMELDEYKSDYVFYFNSNQEFLQIVHPNEIIFDDKLTAVVNCGWDYLGHDPLKFTYGKPVDPKSTAHIPTNDYTYVQSSIFGGPMKLMKSSLDEMHSWTCKDLAHNRIPCFHDESYWNKFVYLNPDKVEILNADYNSCKVNMVKYGHPDAKIAMRDSSETQYKYKDIYHE